MSELKPCPFCGGEAKLVNTWNCLCQIICRSCGANIGGIKRHPNDFRTRDEVIAAWNSRTTEKELVANIIIDEEQLQRMCDEAVSTIIDCAGLLAVADECDAAGGTVWAARIRKAVGA